MQPHAYHSVGNMGELWGGARALVAHCKEIYPTSCLGPHAHPHARSTDRPTNRSSARSTVHACDDVTARLVALARTTSLYSTLD